MNPVSEPDWSPAPHDPAPPEPNTLHLYRLNLGALPAAFFEDLTGFSDTEKARARQLVHPQRRRQFTAGRRSLRRLLGGMLQTAPADLLLTLSGAGKPALDPDRHPGAPFFSLSHTSDWLLIGVTADAPVGVDLEPVAPRANLLSLAERFFSTQEITWLHQNPGPGQPECFFRIWTAKEACVKAWGGGISTGFDRFSVCIDASGNPGLAHELGPQVPGCSLGHFRPHPGMMGAWAVARTPRDCPEIQVHCWDLETLFV